MTKGERIKLLREKANMTQEKLAKLLICIEDEDDHNGHLKRLYDEISKIYETSPGSVERCIRNAIHVLDAGEEQDH